MLPSRFSLKGTVFFFSCSFSLFFFSVTVRAAFKGYRLPTSCKCSQHTRSGSPKRVRYSLVQLDFNLLLLLFKKTRWIFVARHVVGLLLIQHASANKQYLRSLIQPLCMSLSPSHPLHPLYRIMTSAHGYYRIPKIYAYTSTEG